MKKNEFVKVYIITRLVNFWLHTNETHLNLHVAKECDKTYRIYYFRGNSHIGYPPIYIDEHEHVCFGSLNKEEEYKVCSWGKYGSYMFGKDKKKLLREWEKTHAVINNIDKRGESFIDKIINAAKGKTDFSKILDVLRIKYCDDKSRYSSSVWENRFDKYEDEADEILASCKEDD